MTRSLLASRLTAGTLLLVAAAAWAQQPPDPVSSDTYGNTAMGTDALYSLSSSAYSNTAAGDFALYSDTTGFDNTAFGAYALWQSTASSEVAFGAFALYADTTGYNNAAFGPSALFLNTTGNSNTALGSFVLPYSTTGDGNTGAGALALYTNTTGSNNTAFGYDALFSNTTGKGNAAQGVNALYSNTTGIRNLGIGSNALYGNVTGSYNLALGFDAGYNVTGNDNIYFNNEGVSGESQTLRLGTQGTTGIVGSGITTAYIAGVANTVVTGSAVYVTSSGQLGVLASSERFKTDIHPIGGASEKVEQLRPVRFRLKADPTHTVQYGLIAEEVAKVYPELVIHGADGRINGVRYEELAPLLLAKVQQQQAAIEHQQAEIAQAESLLRRQQMEIAAARDRDAAQGRRIEALAAAVDQLVELKRTFAAHDAATHSAPEVLAERSEQ